jgi:hypothetical protein
MLEDIIGNNDDLKRIILSKDPRKIDFDECPDQSPFFD